MTYKIIHHSNENSFNERHLFNLNHCVSQSVTPKNHLNVMDATSQSLSCLQTICTTPKFEG